MESVHCFPRRLMYAIETDFKMTTLLSMFMPYEIWLEMLLYHLLMFHKEQYQNND